jgi:hypothetical protein
MKGLRTSAFEGSACALLACLCLLLSAPAVQAATGHVFVSSVSEAPSGTLLNEPGAVAVDRAAGRVFLADPGHGVVDVFTSAGAYVTQFGGGILGAGAIAVSESSHEVYLAEAGASVVDVFKPDGKGGYVALSEWEGANTPAKEFTGVSALAVDNSKSASAGDVYVVNGESSVVDVFKPKGEGAEEALEGEFLHVLSGIKLSEPNAIAISAASDEPGRVYVGESAKGTVALFSAAGAYEKKAFNGASSPQGSFLGKEGEEGNVTALSVDESSGDLLVTEAERHVISEFDEEGAFVGWIARTPSGSFGEPRGVAVGVSGDVYVADAGLALLDIFGPGVIVPDVKTTPATKVTRTTATFNGTINGDGKKGHFHFEYGESEALGQSTPSMESGEGEEKASASMSKLHAGATYFFRLVGENENGSNYGVIRVLAMRPAVEALATGPAQSITPKTAILTGTLSPNGFDTHYYFEWGLTSAYGSKEPALPGTDAGSATEAIAAKTTLEGLAPNTTYHFRLVGTNEFGATYGEDAHFTTSGPPRITSAPTTSIGHATATLNAKINPDELETEYRFEYGETIAYGNAVEGTNAIPAGEAPVAESVALSKLKLGVTYHFRVVAENKAGVTEGEDQTFTTIPPALIDSESVSEVTASSATLQTQINPLGKATTYYFQYGTESCKANPAGCTKTTEIAIGSGEADVPGSVPIQELKPNTIYYYRVLASNELGTSEGVQKTFTTQPPATPFALPDNRAREMVTPVNKHGAPVEALTREGGWIKASEDGSKLTYLANGAITEVAQGNRSPEMQQVLATRSSEGWSSQDIVTPNAKAQGVSVASAPEYQYFTPDLSHAIVEPWGQGAEPPLAEGVSKKTGYIRDNETGAYLPLLTEADVAPKAEFAGHVHFVSATPGLTHVILQSGVALTGEESGPGLYEWSKGTLQFVSTLPGSSTPGHEPELGFYHAAANAISADGSRIIWTSKEENTGNGHLYMRDTSTKETIQLDKAQGALEPGKGSARFQSASADGSKVFFTDKQQLTEDSTAEPGQGIGKPDLYECEMEEVAKKLHCNLKDLTVDTNTNEHAAVQGFLLGVSEDGSTLYLVAQGVLSVINTNGENGNGERPLAGKDNLYELHYSGTEWQRTFIASLSTEDRPEWEGNQLADSAFLTARVSPSGRYLAFMSQGAPTGYDNRDQSSAAVHDQEVYLYDSTESSLRCVSCNPTGARPVGVLDTVEAGEGLGLVADRRKVWVGHYLAGNIPGWTAQSLISALYQSRYLLDNGRLYFNSPDHLVPRASNSKANVYQYEPAGLGSCESPSGGCVSLLSSGTSGKESAFLEATPSGSDVFFLTASQLSPQDTDTAFDIYDARVCSPEAPCLTPPSPVPPGCSGEEGCRPASPRQPAPVGPSGTATYSGSGNVAGPQAKQEVKAHKTSSKPSTNAQKLAKALKTCRKQRSKSKRKACEAHARKLYGAKKAAKAKAKPKRSSSSSSGRRSTGRAGR